VSKNVLGRLGNETDVEILGDDSRLDLRVAQQLTHLVLMLRDGPGIATTSGR